MAGIVSGVDTSELANRAGQLRALHRPGSPVVLANVWDVASAKIVAGAGYPAIATSSAAVADVLGYEDDDSMPPDEAFGAVGRIARVLEVPLTADMEAGYGLAPDDFVGRLLRAGAVGCNIADTAHNGQAGLVDAASHASRLRAIKEAARAAGVDIVLNARVDVRPGGPDELDEAIRRGRLYLEAGADCVYPIFFGEEAAISALVAGAGGNVNIALRRHDVEWLQRLARLGVARISMGAGLMRATYAFLKDTAERLRMQPA